MNHENHPIVRDVNWVMARQSRSHGLLPVRTVLKKYGDPQEQMAVIHVAGTNGKGSTVNYLKDILTALGYRVGTFTSPHLISHFDRIRINDRWIPEERFNAYVEELAEDIDALDLGMFEIDTLISLLWFREEKVDFAILECGIGGRLSNTNVMTKPLLEIITTIGRDHTAMLGERIEQIAFEKAGIIMPSSACAVGFLLPQAETVIRAHAVRRHARISSPKRNYRDLGEGRFVYRGMTYTVQGAAYQKHNAALALHAAWLMGIDIRDQRVIDAVASSQWLGRFETVSKEPMIIIDGAHNEEGIRALCDSLSVLPHPLRIVFSALRDKPGRQMAAMLKKCCDVLYITEFSFYRADRLEDLSVEDARVFADWKEALREAAAYDEAGCTVVTGSLYFVSQVRAYLVGDEKLELFPK